MTQKEYKKTVSIGRLLDLTKANLDKGNMQSSAKLCYDDACKLLHENADYSLIANKCMRSLSYSVGVFNADFAKAQKIVFNDLGINCFGGFDDDKKEK